MRASRSDAWKAGTTLSLRRRSTTRTSDRQFRGLKPTAIGMSLRDCSTSGMRHRSHRLGQIKLDVANALREGRSAARGKFVQQPQHPGVGRQDIPGKGPNSIRTAEPDQVPQKKSADSFALK